MSPPLHAHAEIRLHHRALLWWGELKKHFPREKPIVSAYINGKEEEEEREGGGVGGSDRPRDSPGVMYYPASLFRDAQDKSIRRT